MIDEDLFNKLPIDRRIEIVENCVREDYTFTEMCNTIDEIKPTLEIEAEKRRKAGAKLAPGKEKFKVRDILASFLKVSHGQVEKIEDIKNAIENNPKKFGYVPDRIENGMSIEYAHKMITTTIKAETPTPDLPKGKFELIYLDPPWKYELELEGSPPYKTMTLEEMKEQIKPPSAKDCVMFMWVTNPKLEEGLVLLKHWGFTYKTNIVWVKQKNGKIQQGTGYYVKGSHELLLIATKGSPGVPPEASRIPSVVFAERTKIHSQKPKIFYEIIEKMYPVKKKIELFSRHKRNDWQSWGDEVDDRK